jgi:hypothetical protein
MPVGTEVLKQDLDRLTHSQLQQVADFVAFLKFRDLRHSPVMLDSTQMANLFAEFADEDRALVNAGISDYAAMLQQEDQLRSIDSNAVKDIYLNLI